MSLLTRIKNFFKRLFHKKDESEEIVEVDNDFDLSEEEVNEEDALEQFRMHNIVFEKLNYLEQYIKIFSLPFPKEYSHYLAIILNHRKEYEEELKKFYNGLLGELTFAIDPECESSRLIAVSALEDEIKDFVDFKFNYSVYNDKFSRLCFKLNQFYNALLDTSKDTSVIVSQLENATQSMLNLVTNVKDFRFFKKDSRKKEIILNYIIYGEYIFLKSSLRCSLAKDFDDYKNNLSKFHNLFIDEEYDSLIFKFFIEDLEQYQLYITANLSQDKMYNHVLKSCQALQIRLNNYRAVFHDSNFFQELIRFENTVDNISDNNGTNFMIQLPETLKVSTISKTSTSIKDTATAVLNMLDLGKAKILCDVISKFKADISWREFYFLCKIFELYDEVVQVSCNTIFNSVCDKLTRLSTRYSQYSNTFIDAEKERLLNYNGSKSKKYVFLLNSESSRLPAITQELQQLRLDFIVSENNVYINHSYFNGFKNLEQNFGHYKLLEELL